MLLVVCHIALPGQPAELTPLLPAATPATQEIRQALLAGNLARAAVLVDRLGGVDGNLWRGIVAIVRNDPTRAIRLLPRTGQPKALGVAYYLARQHVLFREQMAEAIRLSPEDFGAYYYLGRHYDSDIDNAEEAAKWFRLALERNRDFGLARSYLGGCLERLGQVAAAEIEYSASKSVPQSLIGLARLHLGSGDAPAALRLIQKAMEMDPRDAGAAKLAARIYRSLDRPEDVIQALQTASKLAPHDASIRYQLWRAYQAAGEIEKGEAALREFKQLQAVYGASP